MRSLLALATIASIFSSCLCSYTAECCVSLSRRLVGRTFYRNETAYQESIASYWSQQEQELEPACVVIPSNTDDVSIALGLLGEVNSRTGFSCPFALRSGGHTAFAGAANIQAGITIDLSDLHDIIISDRKDYVRVGVGNRWGTLYHKLDSIGYVTAGGRLSGIGVGGLASAGGLSFYAGRLGLVCDAVLNFEVVLANGTVVNANRSKNPSLFRSLKGGSNNLAVITAIDLPLIPSGPIWGGFFGTDISYRYQVQETLANIADSNTYDPYGSVIYSNVFTNGSWIILLHLAYTKQPIAANPTIFSPFLSLPQIFTTLRNATVGELTDEFEAGSPVNSRALLVTMTQKSNVAFMESFFELTNKTISELQNIRGLSVAVSWQPFSQTILRHGYTNGGNILGLTESDGDLMNVDMSIYWQDPKDDAKIYSTVMKLFKSGEQIARKMGVWHKYKFLNYAAPWQNVIASYGQDSVEFIKQVSAAVDPMGIFQLAVPGGFKIPKANV